MNCRHIALSVDIGIENHFANALASSRFPHYSFSIDAVRESPVEKAFALSNVTIHLEFCIGDSVPWFEQPYLNLALMKAVCILGSYGARSAVNTSRHLLVNCDRIFATVDQLQLKAQPLRGDGNVRKCGWLVHGSPVLGNLEVKLRRNRFSGLLPCCLA